MSRYEPDEQCVIYILIVKLLLCFGKKKIAHNFCIPFHVKVNTVTSLNHNQPFSLMGMQKCLDILQDFCWSGLKIDQLCSIEKINLWNAGLVQRSCEVSNDFHRLCCRIFCVRLRACKCECLVFAVWQWLALREFRFLWQRGQNDVFNN